MRKMHLIVDFDDGTITNEGQTFNVAIPESAKKGKVSQIRWNGYEGVLITRLGIDSEHHAPFDGGGVEPFLKLWSVAKAKADADAAAQIAAEAK